MHILSSSEGAKGKAIKTLNLIYKYQRLKLFTHQMGCTIKRQSNKKQSKCALFKTRHFKTKE